MGRFVLGVDVGGTNIKLGLINASGNIIARSYLTTKTFIRNKTKLIDAIIQVSSDLLKRSRVYKKDILGFGIGLPGLIDSKYGVVHFLPNIPGWKNIFLKNIIEKKLKIPTFLDNDVNLITLAEWKFGAGIGIKNLICLTLGTGVGSGLIVNNELYRGEGFTAGELGHIPLNEKGPRCNCGGLSCLERYVGNQYLQKKAVKFFRSKHIFLEEVSSLASQGNPKAIKFWQETAVYIGLGLVSVVNLLNPRCIIIGGGISNSYSQLVKTIYKTIKTRAMRVPASMVKIVKAKLGADAGIIGAQVLVKNATSRK